VTFSWYALLAKNDTPGRCQAYKAPRAFEHQTVGELEVICRESLQRKPSVPFFAAYRELERERQKNLGIVKELVAIGKASPIEEARRLANAMAPHIWQCTTRESNPVWQMVWILCEGPFPGSNDPVDLTGAEQTIARAEERWAAPELEEVPSWCRDGVHVSGDDERFAGTWAGLRNCVAMYAKYGRLSPDDEGVLIKAGTVVTRRRKGLWPVLVESMTEPGVLYEVEPDGDELRCSCPAYRWQFGRGEPGCKHVRRLLEENPGILDLG
jgi:hypothetical protein